MSCKGTFLCLTILGSSIAWGQSARITGIISDTSGAVMSGVEVGVTNVDTGVLRRTTSNTQGNYSVPLLQPGQYRIAAQDTLEPYLFGPATSD